MLRGEVDAAYMVLIVWFMGNMDVGMKSIVWLYKVWTRARDPIFKLRDTFDSIPQITWLHTWADFVYTKWDIVLTDIMFGYNPDKPVFEGLNLTIQWGKTTALVWASGGGKTTVMKMIAWYMHPDSGSVMVDGQPLTNISLQSYYKHIGYLSQEPSVFDGTIRENLMYGAQNVGTNNIRPHNISDACNTSLQTSIEQAIELSHCQFIYDFPDGLDTHIGEKWIRLSWWQRQWLAIAKIFLKNPTIILLDEPTSALDSLSEKLIADALHKLFVWRTVIVIAHRLQTVEDCDQIIWLDNGQIKKHGPPQEVLEAFNASR